MSIALDRRTAILGACLIPVAGCATMATAVDKVAATVTTDVSSAANIYAIVKGVAQVALTTLSVADPAAAALINAGIALVEPIVAKIKAGTGVAATDVSTVISTSNSILATAAPAISVVANAVKAL